ncbi:MAG: FtsX-like permease family protein, partial [Acidobacteriota bacterium]|nr:FtsX-like permease family protein [Acidobacteriota bacterium]
ADIAGITERIAQADPTNAQGLKAAEVPMREELAGNSRRPLLLLLGAVGFVLLIACANIANLLLARAASRRKEIAVRTALGASRIRVVRQLLTESLLLAGLGGGVGLLLASWSFAFLRQLIPPGLRLTTNLKIDLPVFGFALAVSVITGIVFGLLPALQATKVDLNETLKQGGGRGGLSIGGNRLRSALVVTEIALSLVLLVGAGLLIQTLYRLQNQYSLFQPEQLLTMRTVLPDGKYNEHAKRVAFYDQVLERVKALPGVAAVGYTTSVPLQWKGGANGFTIEGQSNPNIPANANHRQISEAYLQTLGIALKQGR